MRSLMLIVLIAALYAGGCHYLLTENTEPAEAVWHLLVGLGLSLMTGLILAVWRLRNNSVARRYWAARLTGRGAESRDSRKDSDLWA